MPNLIQKLTGKIGLRLLKIGGVGRITPQYGRDIYGELGRDDRTRVLHDDGEA